MTIPPFGIRINPRGRVYCSKWSDPLEADSDHGEVLMVVYHDIGDRETWVPHSIRTTEGEYDCCYCKRDGNMYFELSGSPSLYLGKYGKPRTLPCRVWIKPGEKVRLASKAPVEPTDKQLRALGYLRIANIPSPFTMAIEERAHWIESAQDYLPDDEIHTCCECEEPEDRQNKNALMIVFEERGTSLERPGLYKITRFPYYMDGMVCGWIIESSVQRVGDVPAWLSEPNGYPCGFLCVKCSAKHTPRVKRSKAA